MSNPITLPHEERRSTTLAWLGGSVTVALLVRLALWLGYSPVPYSDTPSYRRLAESVLDGFARYDGTRTPGYPAFLALVGGDIQVWLVQMVLGFLITLMLFYLGWRLSGRGWFGALAALAHTLNLGQLFFEANLLTETLTTFYLAIIYVGYFWLLRQESRPRWGLALGVGLATSLALLTRPLFIFLPVWIGLFIAWRISARYPPSAHPENGRASKPAFKMIQAYFLTRVGLARLAAFALPVVLLVGGWVLFIHQRFGDWGLTTMTGYHLVQHTGGYFEYVPDEYAALRDTYIQFRDAKIAATGTQTNAIWEAIPELSRVTGLNFYDLSRTMARISVQLILEHPDLFLKNVLQGWWMFWRAPVYWAAEALQNPAPAEAIAGLVLLQRARTAGDQFDVRYRLAGLGWGVLPPEPDDQTTAQVIPASADRFRAGITR